MPGGSDHRKWSGHPEVHKWIDLPHRWMGRNHRKLFHGPISAPAMGFFAALCHCKNPITGAAAGLLHTVQDSVDSALGGSKTRRARKWLGPVGGGLLLAVLAIVQATSKSTDQTSTAASSGSPDLPPPPTELQAFVLRRHKAGHSRRDTAMTLFKRGHKCERVQEALSIVPRDEWAEEDIKKDSVG